MEPEPNELERLLKGGLLRPDDFDPGALEHTAETAPPLLDGRYRLLGTLGRGAMGVVHRARDEATNREVAIKLIQGAQDERSRARLLREGAATAALAHPGIVRVYGANDTPQGAYLVYELVRDARPLSQVLPDLSQQQRLEVFQQIVVAVAHAHAAGVVHRDLKPENILVDGAGRPRVIDFGLGWLTSAHTLTRTGGMVGTPAYMSPEQIQAKPEGRNPAVDVWALGVFLYELCTDQVPFQGGSLVELGRRICSGSYDPVRSLAPTTPRAIEQVVDHCLQVHPADRYADAGELSWAFSIALTGKSPHARRRSLLPALAVVALVAALSSAAAWGLSRSNPTPPATVPALSAEVHLDRARAAVAEGDLDQALREVEAGVALRPLPELLRLGIDSALRGGAFARASGWIAELPAAERPPLQAALAVLELDPERALEVAREDDGREAMLWKGRAHLLLSDWSAASRALRAAGAEAQHVPVVDALKELQRFEAGMGSDRLFLEPGALGKELGAAVNGLCSLPANLAPFSRCAVRSGQRRLTTLADKLPEVPDARALLFQLASGESGPDGARLGLVSGLIAVHLTSGSPNRFYLDTQDPQLEAIVERARTSEGLSDRERFALEALDLLRAPESTAYSPQLERGVEALALCPPKAPDRTDPGPEHATRLETILHDALLIFLADRAFLAAYRLRSEPDASSPLRKQGLALLLRARLATAGKWQLAATRARLWLLRGRDDQALYALSNLDRGQNDGHVDLLFNEIGILSGDQGPLSERPEESKLRNAYLHQRVISTRLRGGTDLVPRPAQRADPLVRNWLPWRTQEETIRLLQTSWKPGKDIRPYAR